jgi:hypothetical protein
MRDTIRYHVACKGIAEQLFQDSIAKDRDNLIMPRFSVLHAHVLKPLLQAVGLCNSRRSSQVLPYKDSVFSKVPNSSPLNNQPVGS